MKQISIKHQISSNYIILYYIILYYVILYYIILSHESYPMIFPWISIIPWSSGHLPSSPGHRGGRRPRRHVRGQHRGGARGPHAAPGQELLLRGELH